MDTFHVDSTPGPGLSDYLARLDSERRQAADRHPDALKNVMEGLAHVVGYLHALSRLGSRQAVPYRWIKGSPRKSRRRCEPAAWPDATETSVVISNQKLRDAAHSIQGVAGFLYHDAWDSLTDPAKWQFVNATEIRWIDAKPIADEIAETASWVKEKLGTLLPSFLCDADTGSQGAKS